MTALKELSQNTENKVCSYDKGNDFIILKHHTKRRGTNGRLYST